jgi:polygalacturonase
MTSTATTGEANVRDFGARGDGVTDDLKAFEAALAQLGSAGGTLVVPAGTYILKPYRMGALELLGRSNITIAGDGMDQSILRIAPGLYGGATHVMLVANSSSVTVRDITLDGGRPYASYRDQQSHGVEIRNSSDLRFERVRITQVHGDGIRMVGLYHDTGSWTERVAVEDSRFERNGRSGVGMQRATRDVRIVNNTFEYMGDQSLSSEPGGPEYGNVAPRDIVMEGNFIQASGNHSVSLEGPSIADPALRLVFRNNRVENGSVSFRKSDGVLIEGNVIHADPYHPALELPVVKNIQIVDNEISGAGGLDGVVQVRAEYDVINPFPRAFPTGVTLSRNVIRATNGQTGLWVRDAVGDITIVDNQIYGSDRAGIQVLSRFVSGSARSGFTIRGNIIRDFDKGIMFASDGDRYEAVEIEANNIDHDQSPPTEAVGITFMKTGPYEVFASLIANVFGSGIKTPVQVLSQ